MTNCHGDLKPLWAKLLDARPTIALSFIALLTLLSPILGRAGSAAQSGTTTNPAHYLSKKDRPVFYARVFGKDFPIPVRFEYESDPTSPEVEAIFKSPSGVLLERGMEKPGPEKISIEMIQFGSYKAWVKALETHPLPGTFSIKKYRCYGLDVEVRTPLSGLMKKIQRVYILAHNEKQYLLFMVKNKNFVGQLFSLYGAVNDIPVGSGCKLPSENKTSG